MLLLSSILRRRPTPATVARRLHLSSLLGRRAFRASAPALHGDFEMQDPASPEDIVRFVIVDRDARCHDVAGKVGDNLLYVCHRLRDEHAAGAKLALASCNSYESGHFAAFADMARWAPDCVIHIGDYIYEGGPSPLGAVKRNVGGRELSFENVRQHDGPEIVTLTDYRNRYALYRSDASLQAAHAASPWIVAMDDHEIDNNWVQALDQDGTPPEIFMLRQQAAMQAWYEHMPVRRSAFPRGAVTQVYRHASWGDLLDLNFLDTRQYRSNQPCNDAWASTCAGVSAADAHVLGQAQEAWLYQNLDRSQAHWKVLAQQIM